MTILVLCDAFFFPAKGFFSGLPFILIIGIGVWKIHYYKNWFMLSLIFITSAVIFYMIGSESVNEIIVQKLSDWSLIFLLLGAIKLARFSNDKKRI